MPGGEIFCRVDDKTVVAGDKLFGEMHRAVCNPLMPSLLQLLENIMQDKEQYYQSSALEELCALSDRIGLIGAEECFRHYLYHRQQRAKWDPLQAVPFWKALIRFPTDVGITLALYITRFSQRPPVDSAVYSMEGNYFNDNVWTGIPQHDTQYHILLKKEDITVACIGFDINQAGALLVSQIQGATVYDNPNCDDPDFYKNALSPINWDRMLLRIIVDWDNRFGFGEVMVLPAEKNQSWNEADFSRPTCLEEHQRRLNFHYNVNACKNGFIFDKECGYWVLKSRDFP